MQTEKSNLRLKSEENRPPPSVWFLNVQYLFFFYFTYMCASSKIYSSETRLLVLGSTGASGGEGEGETGLRFFSEGERYPSL